MSTPVMAIAKWENNAHLIEGCAQLGYLDKNWRTLDPTYGLGTFWKRWRPDLLVAHDLDVRKSPIGISVDATNMQYPDRWFTASVVDGPYKLNGTPTEEVDARYGVHEPTSWRGRMRLLAAMLTEAARVTENFLLFKCQDQVCSGKVRWQTHEFTLVAEAAGFGLYDRLEYLTYREQPAGTRQLHARRNSSTMLVFKRGHSSA